MNNILSDSKTQIFSDVLDLVSKHITPKKRGSIEDTSNTIRCILKLSVELTKEVMVDLILKDSVSKK